jgi:hypothetical protein
VPAKSHERPLVAKPFYCKGYQPSILIAGLIAKQGGVQMWSEKENLVAQGESAEDLK